MTYEYKNLNMFEETRLYRNMKALFESRKDVIVESARVSPDTNEDELKTFSGILNELDIAFKIMEEELAGRNMTLEESILNDYAQDRWRITNSIIDPVTGHYTYMLERSTIKD